MTDNEYGMCDVCREILPPGIGHLGACAAIRDLRKRVAELEAIEAERRAAEARLNKQLAAFNERCRETVAELRDLDDEEPKP